MREIFGNQSDTILRIYCYVNHGSWRYVQLCGLGAAIVVLLSNVCDRFVTYLLYVYYDMCVIWKFIICWWTTPWCYMLVSLSNGTAQCYVKFYYCNLILTQCYRCPQLQAKRLSWLLLSCRTSRHVRSFGARTEETLQSSTTRCTSRHNFDSRYKRTAEMG